jgi:histidine triad (HIT) family protein
MRAAYGCEGTSIRQHNEPAGGQDVWHLHVHVLPRHDGDRLYERHREGAYAGPDARAEYADRLAAELRLPRSFG